MLIVILREAKDLLCVDIADKNDLGFDWDNMNDNAPTLFYIHDPMCSWCWGYLPVLGQIEQALSRQVNIRYVLGGLAADSDKPMEENLREQIQQHWRNIENLLGTEFNFKFWQENTPRRATYPASRAVIAAREQQGEKAMILAVQQAYYLRAMNPSDDDTLLQLADELGLDFDRFQQSFYSEDTATQLLKEIKLARSLGGDSFPSWALTFGDTLYPIPVDYQSAHTTLAQISAVLSS